MPLGAACRPYPAIPHPLHFLIERMADIEKLERPFRDDPCRADVARRRPAEFGQDRSVGGTAQIVDNCVLRIETSC